MQILLLVLKYPIHQESNPNYPTFHDTLFHHQGNIRNRNKVPICLTKIHQVLQIDGQMKEHSREQLKSVYAYDIVSQQIHMIQELVRTLQMQDRGIPYHYPIRWS